MKKALILLLPLCLWSDLSLAQDAVTFVSFYQDSGFFDNPWVWVISIFAAILVGTIIFFTGGTASPIVVWIGSTIGGTMGLSGAAATNAGLAMLGGGSIANGGLGIAGGTALLTAAFTFSTEVITDYTFTTVINNYQYSTLIAQSEKMPTLPLPRNDSGSEQYEAAIEILKGIEVETISSNDKQAIIKNAISSLKNAETAKEITLKALLYFINHDYQQAKAYALKAKAYKLNGIKNPLASFVYAVSILYDKDFNAELSFSFFENAVFNEPDNKLIPLMLSIYLDKFILRFGFDHQFFSKMYHLITTGVIKEFEVQNDTTLLSRYFILLKQEQQKITTLTNTLNDKIKENSITLTTIEQSLDTYNNIIENVNIIMGDYLLINIPSSYLTKIKQYFSEPEINFTQLQDKYRVLLKEYQEDETRLRELINEFEQYQSYTTSLRLNFTKLKQRNNEIIKQIDNNIKPTIIKESLNQYNDIIDSTESILTNFIGQYLGDFDNIRAAEFKEKLKHYQQQYKTLNNKLQDRGNNWVIYLISILLLIVIFYISRGLCINRDD
ncbi:MAG: hypothetical protein FE834_06725 [Gammaproteobacteria bacterium]|nr:hypothetical protein [Gammaproteobacteria bacterium]